MKFGKRRLEEDIQKNKYENMKLENKHQKNLITTQKFLRLGVCVRVCASSTLSWWNGWFSLDNIWYLFGTRILFIPIFWQVTFPTSHSLPIILHKGMKIYVLSKGRHSHIHIKTTMWFLESKEEFRIDLKSNKNQM